MVALVNFLSLLFLFIYPNGRGDGEYHDAGDEAQVDIHHPVLLQYDGESGYDENAA